MWGEFQYDRLHALDQDERGGVSWVRPPLQPQTAQRHRRPLKNNSRPGVREPQKQVVRTNKTKECLGTQQQQQNNNNV